MRPMLLAPVVLIAALLAGCAASDADIARQDDRAARERTRLDRALAGYAPERTQTLFATFPSTDEAGDALSRISGAGIVPAAIEMCDQLAIEAIVAATHVDWPLDVGALILMDVDGVDAEVEDTAARAQEHLRAAGAIEAIFSILAIRDGVAPPTLNLDEPSRASVVDRVAHQAQERRIDVALSNSFGFGGTNASILFKRAA